MRAKKVAVIGAGMGGLAAALDLAARGFDVTVVERAATPGGKMREVAVGNARIDAGPTVFTMRWVLDEIFAAAGAALDDRLTLRPAHIIARHAWEDGSRLDLFADIDASTRAIAAFAGERDARGYRDFCARAERIYRTLDRSFMRAQKPSLPQLVARIGMWRVGDLLSISPYSSLWRALGGHFADPRLRQLFARYSTYCGSSPFLAPATLMLIAHCEREGVWLVDGGMHQIAVALARLAEEKGAAIRYGEEVAEVTVSAGRASGLRLASGETIAAEAVIANADASALGAGKFGAAVARAVRPAGLKQRSLSAVAWTVLAETGGFPLVRHSVFFSRDYASEFSDIFGRWRLPQTPTVYVCAQDRDGEDGPAPSGPERLLCLVNAPPTGDRDIFGAEEIEKCEERTFSLLARCGLTVKLSRDSMTATTPAGFERLFPATGGALYGRASHGWTASFRRPPARSRMPGLYLAGGSVHPGAGVPMAALSGRLAAARLIADLAST